MVRLSTILIVVGIVLLPVPIPPFATIAGIILILTGIVLRVLTDL